MLTISSILLTGNQSSFFAVIFQNLAGYDSHLFIKNLGKTEGHIDCIPNNEEKYISLTNRILVDTFVKEGKKIEVKRDLRSEFEAISSFYQGDQLQLLLKKGVYPYDYVNTLEQLKETKLPPKEAFYTKLNDENISDKDYQHA